MVECIVGFRQWRSPGLGHTLRQLAKRITRQTFYWNPQGKRNLRRPKTKEKRIGDRNKYEEDLGGTARADKRQEGLDSVG